MCEKPKQPWLFTCLPSDLLFQWIKYERNRMNFTHYTHNLGHSNDTLNVSKQNRDTNLIDRAQDYEYYNGENDKPIVWLSFIINWQKFNWIILKSKEWFAYYFWLKFIIEDYEAGWLVGACGALLRKIAYANFPPPPQNEWCAILSDLGMGQCAFCLKSILP